MLRVFENIKIPTVSQDTLNFVKSVGEDISYTTEDHYVEAYKYKGAVYVAAITPSGPME